MNALGIGNRLFSLLLLMATIGLFGCDSGGSGSSGQNSPSENPTGNPPLEETSSVTVDISSDAKRAPRSKVGAQKASGSLIVAFHYEVDSGSDCTLLAQKSGISTPYNESFDPARLEGDCDTSSGFDGIKVEFRPGPNSSASGLVLSLLSEDGVEIASDNTSSDGLGVSETVSDQVDLPDRIGDDGGDSPSPEPIELTSSIGSDRTLTPGKPYVLSGGINPDFRIENGATLTIEPGTELRFEKDVSLRVIDGSIVAEGTAEDPIIMRATEGNRQPGWWRGIDLTSGKNTLDHVKIRHAGASTSFNLDGQISSITLDGIDEGSLSLTNSTIAQGSGNGLEILSGPEKALRSFSENTFKNLGGDPVRLPLDLAGELDSGTTFPSGSAVRIYTRSSLGSVTENITLQNLQSDVAYRFTETVSLSSGGTLTIKPGVELTFEENVGLEVALSGSSLVAKGEADKPIIFTATDGNQEPGWWNGIGLFGEQTSTLEHVKVRHATAFQAVASESSSIYLGEYSLGGTAGTLVLKNSTIGESENHGIYCQGLDPTLTLSGNSFSGIAGQKIKGCN